MATKLNVKSLGIASASVWGIAYIVCVLALLLAPNLTIQVFDYLTHGIDIASIAKTSVTLGSALIGLILSLIFGYVLGALFARIYNKLAK